MTEYHLSFNFQATEEEYKILMELSQGNLTDYFIVILNEIIKTYKEFDVKRNQK